MSLRAAASLATRRIAATTSHRRMTVMVPKLGTEAEMKQQALEQIRARVKYQKELMKVKEHSHEEEIAEMWRWVNITFMVALPLTGLSLAYSLLFDEHPHRFDGDLPEYMKIRSKEYPWECGDCDLFDLKCWKKCRAEK